MEEAIHPKYQKTTIKCTCGNEIRTWSTKDNIRVEVRSKYYPFFTGKQKLIDTNDRVDTFKKRYDLQGR